MGPALLVARVQRVPDGVEDDVTVVLPGYPGQARTVAQGAAQILDRQILPPGVPKCSIVFDNV